MRLAQQLTLDTPCFSGRVDAARPCPRGRLAISCLQNGKPAPPSTTRAAAFAANLPSAIFGDLVESLPATGSGANRASEYGNQPGVLKKRPLKINMDLTLVSERGVRESGRERQGRLRCPPAAPPAPRC